MADKLLPIKSALELDDPSWIQEQIQIRKRIKSTLVGWLYLSILSYEIEKLQEHLDGLDKSTKDS